MAALRPSRRVSERTTISTAQSSLPTTSCFTNSKDIRAGIAGFFSRGASGREARYCRSVVLPQPFLPRRPYRLPADMVIAAPTSKSPPDPFLFAKSNPRKCTSKAMSPKALSSSWPWSESSETRSTASLSSCAMAASLKAASSILCASRVCTLRCALRVLSLPMSNVSRVVCFFSFLAASSSSSSEPIFTVPTSNFAVPSSSPVGGGGGASAPRSAANKAVDNADAVDSSTSDADKRKSFTVSPDSSSDGSSSKTPTRCSSRSSSFRTEPSTERTAASIASKGGFEAWLPET
mmetsp:Transcript_9267/g.30644  ORF Transcript_9267/g.30644 Transcript_9267/m.30644 type:complete len:292 (+) Transcript_9267:1512-2387(+)